eukprot:Lankesteria_metandrocarpae@DN4553_c0_g1_i1.p1
MKSEKIAIRLYPPQQQWREQESVHLTSLEGGEEQLLFEPPKYDGPTPSLARKAIALRRSNPQKCKRLSVVDRFLLGKSDQSTRPKSEYKHHHTRDEERPHKTTKVTGLHEPLRQYSTAAASSAPSSCKTLLTSISCGVVSAAAGTECRSRAHVERTVAKEIQPDLSSVATKSNWRLKSGTSTGATSADAATGVSYTATGDTVDYTRRKNCSEVCVQHSTSGYNKGQEDYTVYGCRRSVFGRQEVKERSGARVAVGSCNSGGGGGALQALDRVEVLIDTPAFPTSLPRAGGRNSRMINHNNNYSPPVVVPAAVNRTNNESGSSSSADDRSKDRATVEGVQGVSEVVNRSINGCSSVKKDNVVRYDINNDTTGNALSVNEDECVAISKNDLIACFVPVLKLMEFSRFWYKEAVEICNHHEDVVNDEYDDDWWVGQNAEPQAPLRRDSSSASSAVSEQVSARWSDVAFSFDTDDSDCSR